jgi:OPT family oligopeptide transporter
MQVYNEVPDWWYGVIGCLSVVLGVIAIETFPTHLPIWGLLCAFLLAASFTIPIGMIKAITNQQIPLQVMAELIPGYLFPGRPVANMIFKALTYTGTQQAITFSGDLKLGHYIKIPPRIMFTAQVLATTVSCFVVIGVQNVMFSTIVDFVRQVRKTDSLVSQRGRLVQPP